MGFTDEGEVIKALQTANGDIGNAVAMLLSARLKPKRTKKKKEKGTFQKETI